MGIVAHAGHWATSLLYLAPIAVLGIWLGSQSRRDRRRQDRDRAGADRDRD